MKSEKEVLDRLDNAERTYLNMKHDFWDASSADRSYLYDEIQRRRGEIVALNWALGNDGYCGGWRIKLGCRGE